MNESLTSWRHELRSSHERGYGSAWQRARRGFLLANPLCVMCSAEGKTSIAQVVDHIQPHRGDQSLFWNQSNWQSLCKQHHDSDKARQEHGTRERAKFDVNGRLIW
jgi:5-methylcytosine-specific restriction endonuclease McrA